MSGKPKGSAAGGPPARIGLRSLAWRLAEALPPAERRKLALQLIESDAEEIVFCRGGITWTGFVWDRIITGNLFAYGSFQRREVESLLAWMKRRRRLSSQRNVIVDVGANIGTTAIPFALKTSCQVLAIEPVPEIHSVLCRNIAANGLGERIKPVAAAIAAGRARQVRMAFSDENSGASEVVRAGRKASFAGERAIRREVDVQGIGLEKLLAENGIKPERVALVWADVQGSEADVIATAPKLWAGGVPLFCEVDPQLWANGGDSGEFLRQARRHFSRFIPAKSLVEKARAWPIAELPAFCRALTPAGGDVLLLNEGYRR